MHVAQVSHVPLLMPPPQPDRYCAPEVQADVSHVVQLPLSRPPPLPQPHKYSYTYSLPPTPFPFQHVAAACVTQDAHVPAPSLPQPDK